jgi:Flp pilus assembly protein TadB
MVQKISQQDLANIATITDAPALTRVDRSFGLPTGLYVATVASYFGFIGIMALTLMNPELVMPMAIFALVIVAGFGVPTVWVRMNPAKECRALTFDQFRHRGIDTLTGRLSAGQASVQVLILPVLILAWGIACSVIIALT